MSRLRNGKVTRSSILSRYPDSKLNLFRCSTSTSGRCDSSGFITAFVDTLQQSHQYPSIYSFLPYKSRQAPSGIPLITSLSCFFSLRQLISQSKAASQQQHSPFDFSFQSIMISIFLNMNSTYLICSSFFSILHPDVQTSWSCLRISFRRQNTHL